MIGTLVRSRVQVRMADEGGRVLRMSRVMYLEYDPARPFAVRLADPGGSELVFARDLLDAALSDGRAGEGDVRLHLTFQARSHFLLLWRPGACPFGLKTESVATFLERTYAQVPVGRERGDPDLELEVQMLLGWAA
jgi:Streptomyces sporulation and cell division protein, SsgA